MSGQQQGWHAAIIPDEPVWSHIWRCASKRHGLSCHSFDQVFFRTNWNQTVHRSLVLLLKRCRMMKLSVHRFGLFIVYMCSNNSFPCCTFYSCAGGPSPSFPSLCVLRSHWLLHLSGVADSFQMFSTLDIWLVSETHWQASRLVSTVHTYYSSADMCGVETPPIWSWPLAAEIIKPVSNLKITDNVM